MYYLIDATFKLNMKRYSDRPLPTLHLAYYLFFRMVDKKKKEIVVKYQSVSKFLRAKLQCLNKNWKI